MALFKRKVTFEDVLEYLKTASDDEKEKVKATMEDVDKAEDEREIDKIEEEKAQTPEVADEKEEEVKEESEEIGEKVDEAESEVQGEEAADTEEQSDDAPADTQQDEMAQDNTAEVIKGLSDRVQALESKLAEYDELVEKMKEFTEKQAKQFGYTGKLPTAKKSYDEMSAAEMKAAILNGEN